jgi:hypothetical protein
VSRRAEQRPAVGRLRAVRRQRHRSLRGYRGAGGGRPAFLPIPLSWRGTTRHLCGLFPWSAPGGLPLAGTPIGRHQRSGETVCFDHIGWFQAGLIANPSVLIMGKPGLGKSTLACKLCLGLVAQGYVLLVPGDTKPDYTQLGEQLGCEIRSVRRRGGWALNPCDPGGMVAAAARIGGPAGEDLLGEAIARAVTLIAALIELCRQGPVADYEQSVIGAALRHLYEQRPGGQPPTIADLLQLIRQRPELLWLELELDYTPWATGDEHARRAAGQEFERLTQPLLRSLRALIGGKYGDVFSRPTVRRPLDTGAVIDTSAIKAGNKDFLAAVLIAAWADTYGQVEANAALADAGLQARKLYCLVLDELWRVLELGGSLPERVNELTRLNRTDGIGQIMICHSANDLEDTGSTRTDGIAERAGALVIGGIPKKEVARLEELVTLTSAERAAVTSWWSMSQDSLAEPVYGPDGRLIRRPPPGAGKFLIKVSGDQPGIPVDVLLTSVERAWGGQQTSARWDREQQPDPVPLDNQHTTPTTNSHDR